jgi:hypothetical protein
MPQTRIAIIMKGKPPVNPANPLEMLWDSPPIKMHRKLVPISPAISLTV